MCKSRLPVVLMLFLTSCASTGGGAKPLAAPAAADPGGYAPTKDAQFTIFCARVTGPGHVERAMRSRDTLKQSTGMKDWYVIIENDQTILYYGYYKTIDDPKGQLDRKKIDLMHDDVGNRPFKSAVFVELTARDPAAPPEWNLLNASGIYTLQIGVYRGSPQRKEAAVQSVKEARAQGIEAYYYHGESASLVCIGSWPEGAIKVTDGSDAMRRGDPSQPIYSVPMTNDPEINQMYDDAARAANAKLIRQQVQIVDPTLEEARQKYPYNSLNGALIKKTVEGKEEYDHSLIWDIRKLRKKPASPVQTPGVTGVPAYDPSYRPQIPRQTSPAPQQPAPSNNGRLKSIGD